jgi:hypothetical protein
MQYNKPEITEEVIKQINELIKDNPGWNRTRLSKSLCEIWGWRNPNGQVKDISCRDMLRALDKEGRIKLPEKTKPSRQAGEKMKIKHICHDTAPVKCDLKGLLPLDIAVVCTGPEMDEFKSLLDQYHYLGFDRTVGENMKYMVRSRGGTLLSCLLYGSAAWACKDRDSYIGWDAAQRKKGLPYMTNNTRFLIPPWVTVPHLASHILGQVARRVSKDWGARYGHGLYCLETFVERGRFRGTCYKAANWQHVGLTTGRGRNSVHAYAVLPQKDVYLYPLTTGFRRMLADVKEVF